MNKRVLAAVLVVAVLAVALGAGAAQTDKGVKSVYIWLSAIYDRVANTGVQVASNAIGANQIANNAIDADAIADNAIDADAIATNAIDADAIADNAIDADAIATNAIGSEELASSAVTKIWQGKDKVAQVAADTGDLNSLEDSTGTLLGPVNLGKVGLVTVTATVTVNGGTGDGRVDLQVSLDGGNTWHTVAYAPVAKAATTGVNFGPVAAQLFRLELTTYPSGATSVGGKYNYVAITAP